jgi:hypothetical protein
MMSVEAIQIHVERDLVGIVTFKDDIRVVEDSEMVPDDLVPIRRLSVVSPVESYENFNLFIGRLRRDFTDLGIPYFSVDFELLSDREQNYFDGVMAPVNGEGKSYVRLKLVAWDYPVMH